MLFKKKAQTVLELGLFGAIIIIVFGTLVSYTQRLNDNQYTLMKNFRAALKKAHDENAVVSYTTLEDVRHADINSPMEGSRTTLSASNYIYWAVPFVGEAPNSRTYYKVNEEEILLGDDEEIEEIIFTYDTQVDRTFIKNEDDNLITTHRTVDVQEDLTYDLVGVRTITHTRSDGPRSRTWETEHE